MRYIGVILFLIWAVACNLVEADCSAIVSCKRGKQLRRDQLIEDLNLSFPYVKTKYSSLPLFPFSNEFPLVHPSIKNYRLDYRKSINMLSEEEPLKSSSNVRVAFLVGNSSVHGSLPELAQHVDLVLMIDLETNVHEWTKCYLKSLTRLPSASIDQLMFNLKTCSKLAENMIEDIFEDQENLDYFHPLASEERLRDSQEALHHLKFHYITLNIFDIPEMYRLADILNTHHAVITVINLSNAPEWNLAPVKQGLTALVDLVYYRLVGGTSLAGFKKFHFHNQTFLFWSQFEKTQKSHATHISHYTEMSQQVTAHGYDSSQVVVGLLHNFLRKFHNRHHKPRKVD